MLDIANKCLIDGKFDEAEYHYNIALNNDPTSDQALFGLGCVYTQRQHYGAAAAFYKAAFDVNGKNLSAAHNLAAVLGRIRQKEQARSIYAHLAETVESTDIPNKRSFLADIYGNWAGMYVNCGMPAEAIALGRKGIKYDPEHKDCNNHLALGLLEIGEWEKAFPHWEKRLQRHDFHKRNYAPVWDGKKTKCLVIHGEQGVGDEIMFLSVLNDIRNLADEIVVECNPRLVNIVQQSFNVPAYSGDEVMKHNPTAQIAMGSLFFMMRKRPKDCPGTPYLKANPALVRKYKSRLPGRNIGLAWLGGTDRTHFEVRRISLDALAPLFNAKARFVSLQYGDVAADADRHDLVHYQYAIDDLEHQIALIQAMDTVVTTCQSVVHFAGALGKETYCLTPRQVRWCYGQHGEKLPLYNSVKLIRQNDHWGPAIYHIAKSLDMREAAE